MLQLTKKSKKQLSPLAKPAATLEKVS
ncbi:hypothetical protein EMIT0357P_100107 [Pseudomonas marginalis]